MGLIESAFQFTGSLGNVSAYRMRGVDKIVVRKKGGATKERIMNDRNFANTRALNAEFAGRSKAVRFVAGTFPALRTLADYNFFGHLNARIKSIQQEDRETGKTVGSRSILMSQHGHLLQGFSLNRYTTLEQIVRMPITAAISRETRSATISLPALIPGISFFPPKNCSYFRIVVTIGAAPDLHLTGEGKDKAYKPLTYGWEGHNWMKDHDTPWAHVRTGAPASSLDVALDIALPDEKNYGLIVSVGIAFGVPAPSGSVERVKRLGTAKILAVG